MRIKTECELYEALARGTKDFFIIGPTTGAYWKRNCYLKGTQLWGDNEGCRVFPLPHGWIGLSKFFKEDSAHEIYTEEPPKRIDVTLGQVFDLVDDPKRQAVVYGFSENQIYVTLVPREQGYHAPWPATTTLDRTTGSNGAVTLCVNRQSTS